jgi:hypothetical protein
MSLPQLRPLTFGEILDGAFALYRRHFTTFVGTALFAYAPFILVKAAAAFGVLPDTGPLVDRILATLGAILTYGGITRQASDAYLGQEVSFNAGLRAAGSRFRPVWATIVFQNLALALGLLAAVIPGVLAFIVMFAMMPVVVLEGRDSSQAYNRSKELARGAWKQVLGTNLVFFLAAWVPVLGCLLGVGFMEGMLSPQYSASFEALSVVIVLLALAVAQPLQVVGTVLLYYDRRVRTEALDLGIVPQAEPETSAQPALA